MLSSEKLEELSLEASEEIGEAEAKISDALENLKKSLEENYKDLRLPPNPDDLLLRFLRASKFNSSKAAKQVSQYFKLLHQTRDIHHLFNSSSIEHLLRGSVYKAFKGRDKKGRIIIQYRQEFLPPSPGWVDFATAGFFLIVDYLHRISIPTQRIGVVFLIDMKGFSWSHLGCMRPGQVIKMTKLVTLAFPARIKGFEFVRNPGIFLYLLAIAKPFISAKIMSRFHLHGENFQSLQVCMELETLPKFLGGNVPDQEWGCDVDELFAKLVGEDEYYEDLLKYGYS